MKISTLILNRVGGGEVGGGGGPSSRKDFASEFPFQSGGKNLSLTIKISFCPIFFLHKSLVSWLNLYYFTSCTTFLSKIFYKCCKNAILSSTSFPRSNQHVDPDQILQNAVLQLALYGGATPLALSCCLSALLKLLSVLFLPGIKPYILVKIS